MSSKRHKRRRSCESKVAYDTPGSAHGAILRMNARRYLGPMRVYRCKFCKRYHIGHKFK